VNQEIAMIRSFRDASPTRLRRRSRPTLDRLEERTMLSIFVVNTVSDLDSASGLPAGQESLRQAIEDANADANPGVDTIDFNIAGSGVQTIQPLSQLPIITHSVFIDGYSQPGSSPNTLAVGDNAVLMIELDGSFAGPSSHALLSTSANNTIRGLDIHSFSEGGLFFSGGPNLASTAGDNVVQGCFIGTDPTGETLMIDDGVYATNNGNLIGTNGDGVNDLAERNVLEGVAVDGSNNIIAGNYIGTDATGTKALNNIVGQAGVQVLQYGNTGFNRIGVNGHDVDAAAEGNLISGNGGSGVVLLGTGHNVVAGNYIGTDVTGTQPLGNGGHGVEILNTYNLIGTDGDSVGDAAERNIISANVGAGVTANAGNEIIAGNFIGTDVTGTQPLGNGQGGIAANYGYGSNRIGTDGVSVDNGGERNVISCNGGQGIVLGGGNPIRGISSPGT
jgi:hypothetical protein